MQPRVFATFMVLQLEMRHEPKLNIIYLYSTYPMDSLTIMHYM